MSDRDQEQQQQQQQQQFETGGNEGFTASARQRAIEAYDRAGRRASDTLDEAPLLALAGGLAAGALIAALLPRTEAETRALRPVGKRIKSTAGTAAQAAKDAGTARLAELGLTRERGSEVIRSIIDGASDAARTSAQAALGAARGQE